MPSVPHTAMTATVHDDSIYNDRKIIVPFCNVKLSTDLYQNTETIVLDIKENHPLQGLDITVSPDWDKRLTIDNCKLGSPCRNVKD